MQSLILMSTTTGLPRGGVLLALSNKLQKSGKQTVALKMSVNSDAAAKTIAAHGVAGVAFAKDEARLLALKGDDDGLINGALNLIDEKSSNIDARIIDGFGSLGNANVEWKLNVELARITDSAVVLLLDAMNHSAKDIIDEAKLSLHALEAEGVTVAGVIAIQAADRDALAAALAKEDIKLWGVFPKFDEDLTVDAKVAQTEAHLESAALQGELKALHSVMPPRRFLRKLSVLAKVKKQKIVLPEGNLDRIILATADLRRQDAVDIVLLGDENEIREEAKRLNVTLDDHVTIVNPATDGRFEDYANTLYELRKAKGLTPEKAHELMGDRTYFGTMMVKKGDADGMVSGATTSTAATLRPALQFIKTKPGIKNVTSTFLMCLKDQVMLMGDCAVIPNPTAEQLADVAISSAATARAFDLDPKIAMLSYSTGNSGSGPDVDLVREATSLVRERAPELAVEGPIQYDAAVSPVVAKTKLPESKVAGHANVFVFPDLSAGNPGYKAVQRSSGAVAIGPVLQGLNKPVNDLSRGANVVDIVNTVLVTAIQAQQN